MLDHEPDPQMVHFFQTEMEPILLKLGDQKYGIAEVQKVYQSAASIIVKNYGRTWQNFLDDRPPKYIITTNKSISPMASTIFEGIPTISIFITEWLKIYQNHTFGSRELFETALIIGYLHELIHLALGLAPQNGDEIDREHMLFSEKIVWADTCKHVIAPFVKAGRLLCENEHEYYCAWLQCGQDDESVEWENFIEERYKHLQFLKT